MEIPLEDICVLGGITPISCWVHWALSRWVPGKRSPTLGPLKHLSGALGPLRTGPPVGYWPGLPCRRQKGREPSFGESWGGGVK